MTEKEKQLLLKDLCTRELYHPRIQVFNDGYEGFQVGEFDTDLWFHHIDAFRCDRIEIRPYLRPMSSMTKDEYKELREMTITSSNLETAAVLFCERHYDEEPNWRNDWSRCKLSKVLDYLDSHHFDYRGLIPMGLALEVKEGMYDRN